MSFADYWYRKQRANPELNREGKVTFDIEAFRREVEKAYKAGVDDTRAEKPPPSILEGMFGR